MKTDLELGYAVLHFFENGGMIAWVVRVARNPTLLQWQRGLSALARFLLVLPGVESTEMLSSHIRAILTEVYYAANARAKTQRAFYFYGISVSISEWFAVACIVAVPNETK